MGTVPPPPELPPERPPSALPAEEDAVEQHVAGAGETAAPEAASTDEQSAARRPRRGRLPLLLASAALLGIVAGVATGYTVQAARKPTALPPLSQHTVKYPKKRLSADEVTPVGVKHDHRAKTDGDLRKLLVPKPKGAGKVDLFLVGDGWVSLAAYAQQYQKPDRMFRSLSEEHVRRIASRSWRQHGLDVSVQLIQFRDHSIRHAAQFAIGQQVYMHRDDFAGYEGKDLPGSGAGRYWGDHTADRHPGYLPMYTARAVARRGNLVMDVHIYDIHPISEKTIRTVAEKQLERL